MAKITSSAPQVSVDQLGGFVTELIDQAGKLTQSFFRNSELEVDTKGDGSPVTQADRQAEQLIRAAIEAEFPNDLIFGEEYGTSIAKPTGQDAATLIAEIEANPRDLPDATNRRLWIIDPIDGTKAFTAGVPLYSNLLSVIDNNQPVLGAINLPALGEMVLGIADSQTTCNGELCRVKSHDRLKGAYVMSSAVGHWPGKSLNDMFSEGAIVRTWGDGYGYCLVATGRADAMIDPEVEVWDVGPLLPIIDGAGGRFTDILGNRTHLGRSGIASNGHIHNQIVSLFANALSAQL